jgi:hypothetical protein
VASFRSDDVRIELVTEQESSVDDLQVDDGGISWTQTGGPDAYFLTAFCEDEGLDDLPSEDDISLVRVALQQRAALVSDDETLRTLMFEFGGRSLPRAEFAAAPNDL